MNYTEITNAALAYTDRKDAGTVSNIDTFIRVVESRVKSRLTIQDMAVIENIPLIENVTRYSLPSAFKSLIDLKYNTEGSSKTLALLSLDQFAAYVDLQEPVFGYIRIGNLIELGFTPSADDSLTEGLELSYFKTFSDLTSVASTNWLSINYPDIYIFGLCTEISAFVKDAEAASLWDIRFKDSINTAIDADDKNRWSASSIITRTL